MFTDHATDVLRERKIPEDWVWLAVEEPDAQEIGLDGNTHFVKAVVDYEGRMLRVVVNMGTTPKRIVTVFFDRRLRRKP